MPDLRERRRLFGGAAVLFEIRDHRDDRGSLVAVDFAGLPFTPRRMFAVRDVAPSASRGAHAHARGGQLLICLSGSVAVELRHGEDVDRVDLASPADALLLGEQVWATQRYSGTDAVLLVLASEPYDATSYVGEAAGRRPTAG